MFAPFDLSGEASAALSVLALALPGLHLSALHLYSPTCAKHVRLIPSASLTTEIAFRQTGCSPLQ